MYGASKAMLQMYLFKDLSGVVNKYRSVSQHGRLTAAVHLDIDVVQKAAGLLDNAIDEN